MELLRVSACGENYEEALANCFVKCMDLCGQPNAQIFRREDEAGDAIKLVDWILETAKGEASPGNQVVCVEAEFFLWGSDE